MSKKQQTLFQSWASGSSSNAVSNKTGPEKKTTNDDMLLGNDDEDALLRQALEESLREYNASKQNSNVPPSPSLSSASSSGYSSEVPSGLPVENLPGFDNDAGKTWIYPTNKPVRKYQRDIVETSLFQNTMVTLPTGLGKTFIAAVVMYNYFRWYPRGKIIFLAPTKPLVAQQIQACYEIMGIPLECTSEMTGAMNPTERKRHWKEKRVFFLTPQVLTNDISRGTCPTAEVKCLVLDEAHKALGNHAYVQVVQELTKHGAIFRILALSATPGSDLKSIQQVLANLQISKIEVRNEESPDIVPYVHSRSIEKVIVPLGPEIAQVRDRFLTILSTFARRLMDMNLLFTKDIGSMSKGMVMTSRERFRQNPPGNFSRAQSGMAEGDFAMCITLTHALELLLQHGIRAFYNFLAGKTDSAVGEGGGPPAPNRTRTELLKVKGFSLMMEELKAKFGLGSDAASAPVSHPKLIKLREIVLEHFAKADAEKRPTRVMIFSQFRDSVYEIVSLFEDSAPLIKAMSFVGHGKGTSSGTSGTGGGGSKTKGFTQADQIRVIKQFTEGSYNTLVSTCVGEEGLDIGDVDMIICYDVHKSPVRLVQRCGRTGRKRDGRIVMLMTEGKEEHVFNQSMYQKKNLHKNMMSSDKLKDHLVAQGPRLIPRHLLPRCHEMPMQVVQAFPVPVGRAPKGSSAAAGPSTSSAARRSRATTTKCYYLSEAEADYWARNLDTSEPVPLLPDSGRASLVESRDFVQESKPLLRLDKWLPWQSSLQAHHRTGHSTLTKNYVDIVGIIQKQHGDWFDRYDQQMLANSFHGDDKGDDVPLEEFEAPAGEPDWHFEENRTVPCGTGVEEDDGTHRGLYSPDFLNLFSCADPGYDSSDDIPSPPPFDCYFSSEGCALPSSPPRTTAQDLPLPAADPFPDVTCNFDMEVDLSCLDDGAFTIPKTPPRAEADEDVLEPSPILSQRRRPNVKRKLEATISTPAPPSTNGGKRIKMEPSIEPDDDDSTLVGLPNSGPPKQQGILHVKEENAAEAMVAQSGHNEESILSVTQIVDYVSAHSQAEVKQEVALANFDLEVDFDDSPSSMDAPPAQQDDAAERCLKSEAKSTPPQASQQRRIAPLIPESPVFDFTGGSSPHSTPPPHPPVPKADFSFSFPEDMDDLGVSALEKSPEASTTSTAAAACSIAAVSAGATAAVQAEFSFGLPDDFETEVPPLKGADDKTCKDLQSAWDDGFVLDLDDIEEMNALENAATSASASAAGKEQKDNGHVRRSEQSERSRPAGGAAAAPPLSFIKTEAGPARGSDTSRIRREMEDIFGPEEDVSILHGSPAISKGPPAPRQPSPPSVVLIDTDDEEDCLAATPPAGLRTPGALGEEEDSPMVGCRRNPGRRNLLLTQSTPVVQRRPPGTRTIDDDEDEVRKSKKNKKKVQHNSFIDDEAELSSVDGHCSEDEVEETGHADGYQESFVDDEASEHISDKMRAVYLRSVKSPVGPNAFVFRQPARKEMNRSEIFSQAVVEQDSDYMIDSFCVESDEVDESALLCGDEEVSLMTPQPSLPDKRRRTRANNHNRAPPPAKNPVRNNNNNNGQVGNGARKRIVLQPDSSDDSETPSPPKVFKVPSPPPAVLDLSGSSGSSGTPPSFSLSREERLERQRQKQEAFRRSMAAKNNAGSSGTSSVPSSDRSSIPSVTVSAAPAPAPANSAAPSGAASRVLISSRQVSTAGQIISTLQVKFRCPTHVCSFNVADFVVSPQLGVLRKLHSDFTNGSNRCRLQEQVRRMSALYDKPYLIVEADRGPSSLPPSRESRCKGDPSSLPDASSIIFKPSSPYLLQTLAALAQTELSVLHSHSQEHTARLLHDLGRLESLRGLGLPDAEKLSSKEETILRFLHRVSEINPGAALLMATTFRTLREILNSSAEMITQRCKISANKAGSIVHAFRANHPGGTGAAGAAGGGPSVSRR